MKIGVYGSAADGLRPDVNKSARELGREIARRGHTLVTGACPGYPYEALLGAKELDGRFTGFSPALNVDSHVVDFKFPSDFADEFVFISPDFPYCTNRQICLKYRNILSVNCADAGVIIGGQTGTMNEFTLLYDAGKNIGILEGSSGIADNLKDFMKRITKDRGSELIFDERPDVLIEVLERLMLF